MNTALVLKTCYYAPWALIRSGAVTPGRRPGTQLAWITEAIAEHGEIVAYKVVPHLGDERPTKRARTIPCDSVVRVWRTRPHPKTLAKVRAGMRPTQIDGAACTKQG